MVEVRAARAARLEHPAWRAALASEDLALAAALASSVGVEGLTDALGDEDRVRALALRAIPLSARAEVALGPLGAALAAGRGDEDQVADAIEGALVAARRDRELEAADGALGCAAELRGIADAGGRGGLTQERAVSLSRRVAERTGVAPAGQASAPEDAAGTADE